MIAIDTNILVYAHRSDSPFHGAADRAVTRLAESGELWAIPWPCIHDPIDRSAAEFYRRFGFAALRSLSALHGEIHQSIDSRRTPDPHPHHLGVPAPKAAANQPDMV
ncbi:type II toxin-antitoxin system VapC family toxin [Endothiovibrio diazotrophicus]